MKLFLRLCALVVIALSPFLSRGTAHDRVLLIVLEGARLREVRQLARAGHLPALEGLIAGGVGGEIVGAAEVKSADAIIRSLLAPEGSGAVAGRERATLWSLLARQERPFVLIGAPGTEFRDEPRALVLAGPDAGRGFVGISTGTVVSRRSIERGQVPWPYSNVGESVAQAARETGDAGETDWIGWSEEAGSAEARGSFKAYALDGDTLWLSPVYLRTREVSVPGTGRVLYVADDPSAVRTSSRAREYLPAHLQRVAGERAAVARTMMAARDWDLMVYVDRRMGVLHEKTDGEDIPSEAQQAYRELDPVVGTLLESAGPRTAGLVVGITGEPKEEGQPLGWFAVSGVVGDLSSWGTVSVEDLAATVSYLLSFDLGPGHPAVPAVATRFPLRARVRIRPGGVGEEAGSPMPAVARSLQVLSRESPSVAPTQAP